MLSKAIESISVEVKGSKVANFTVLVALSSTLSKIRALLLMQLNLGKVFIVSTVRITKSRAFLHKSW